MEVAYSPGFLKQFKKAPKVIQKTFKRRLSLFIDDPFQPWLRNHALQGKYFRYRSINVTGDWRALYEVG